MRRQLVTWLLAIALGVFLSLVLLWLWLLVASATELPPPFSDLTIGDVNRFPSVVAPPVEILTLGAEACLTGPATVRDRTGAIVLRVLPGADYPPGCRDRTRKP